MTPCLCDVSLCTFCDDARAAEYARSGLPVFKRPRVARQAGGPEMFDDMEADCE